MISAVVSTGCYEQLALDWQMRGLCSEDGGRKVYETVMLPDEMFSERGEPFPQYRRNPLEERLGSEYRLILEIKTLKEGNPSLTRFHSLVVRKIDSKTLGESVAYSRVGGDLPGPWHPSFSTCPEGLNGEVGLVRAIFIKQ